MVGNTDALKMIRLSPLMVHTAGKPEIGIGLIDGPVVADHPGLVRESIREIGIIHSGTCVQHAHPACIHGTFIAGILTARRGSGAPAICPNCTLYSHAIFTDRTMGGPLSATPRDLGMAILNCIAVGARVLNISAAVSGMVASGRQFLTGALDYAATHGVIVVVAAGNDGAIGSSILTRHPWVIPVVGYDLGSRPMDRSNYGRSIGAWGLAGPGDRIRSLGSGGGLLTLGGTSVATAFVTGAIALIWSEFPSASAAAIKLAVQARVRRRTVVPPLLDAWTSYQAINTRSTNA